MITRRSVIATALGAAAFATGTAAVRAADAPTVVRGGSASQKSLTVVYLSADDCPACRSWERAKRPVFLNSPEGRKAPLREVSRRAVRQPVAEINWPRDLQWLPNATTIPRPTPSFLLVQGEKILAVVVGSGGFDREIVAKIRQM